MNNIQNSDGILLNKRSPNTSPITVVIPTYNGEHYIGKALASLAAQTLLPYETIVVDDCSKDNTREVLSQYAENLPYPLRFLESERNSGGPAIPLNRGISLVKTPFIAILEQDDTSTPKRLESVVNVLQVMHDVVVVGKVSFVEDSDAEGKANAAIAQFHGLTLEFDSHGMVQLKGLEAIRALLKRNFFISNSNLAFSYHLWRQVGGYNTRLRSCTDLDFGLRCASMTDFVILSEVLCIYHIRANSLFRTNLTAAAETGSVRLQAAMRYLPQHDVLVENMYWILRVILEQSLQAGKYRAASYALWQLLKSRIWLQRFRKHHRVQ